MFSHRKQLDAEKYADSARLRIHSELLKLGFQVAQSTVAKYMARSGRGRSQSWKTFLHNHSTGIGAMDFLIVPTAGFRLLFVLVILRHERRRLVSLSVTDHPTAEWIARQITDAFPWDEAPDYLIRDRDACYRLSVPRTTSSSIDGETRREAAARRADRAVGPGGGPAHPCLWADAFETRCNSSRSPQGSGVGRIRQIRRCDQGIPCGSSRSVSPHAHSAKVSARPSGDLGCPSPQGAL
jgi:hypothetical protein